jgi:hypothetical protein
MIRRRRFVAGMLSSWAYLCLNAWGVWASTCAADVEPGRAGAVAHAEMQSDGTPGAAGCMGDATDHSDANCPTGLSGSDCGISTSLPASPREVQGPRATLTLPPTVINEAGHFPSSPFFRPPKL